LLFAAWQRNKEGGRHRSLDDPMLPCEGMGQAGAAPRCGNCGTLNPPNEQFCTHCGYSLAGGPTGPTPTPPQPGTNYSQSNPSTVAAPSARRVTGSLSAGYQLGGRYRIIRSVGKGGFGAVYEAADERFRGQRIVAIKEMSDAQLSASEKTQALEDFRQEANLLVQLHHQHLPTVSDFFEEGGKAYLVMEFIQGQTLEKAQDDASGPLDESKVMGYALQLCEVLSYLHTRPQPIIFRDLKPSNIMVTPDDEIKLIDFGIARVFKSAARKDTTSLGSGGYAPLEQYGRGQSDARSDIYALGATLYDLLTKTTPVDAPARRVNPLLFKMPRQINPAISPITEQIILKAMQEDPKDRFQTALEMYQAIVASGVAAVTSNAMPTIVTPLPGAASTMPTLPVAPLPGSVGPTAAPGVIAHNPPPATYYGSKAGPVGAAYPAATPGIRPPSPPPGPPRQRGVSRRRVLVGGLVGAVLIAGGGTTAYLLLNSQKGGPGSSPSGTITVNFVYSTEKEAWMKAATDAFHQSNPTYQGKAIQVALNELGSVDAHAKILSGEVKPAAWSPASFLELNQLNNDWQQAHSGQDVIISSGDLEPKSLVSSPLVFTIWKDRAQVLQKHYGADKIDWPAIHDAVTLKNGWPDIGGHSDWGNVKFGQTRPDQSNSGLLTITLMAYSYFSEQRGLTTAQVDDSGFLKYLQDIEVAVNAFGRSSGTFLQNIVIPNGPAQYDIVTTYENLVLTLQQQATKRWGQALQLFYPGLNIVSDHPFAILQGSWVSQEEQAAAQVFRDFLLLETQQRAALASGFRPSNPQVQITDKIPNNPFLGQSADIQIHATIQPLAQAPGGNVVNELIEQWQNYFGDAATTTGG
jgi:serine/threonine protein kinase